MIGLSLVELHTAGAKWWKPRIRSPADVRRQLKATSKWNVSAVWLSPQPWEMATQWPGAFMTSAIPTCPCVGPLKSNGRITTAGVVRSAAQLVSIAIGLITVAMIFWSIIDACRSAVRSGKRYDSTHRPFCFVHVDCVEFLSCPRLYSSVCYAFVLSHNAYLWCHYRAISPISVL